MQLMLPFVTNGLAVRTTPRPDKHYVITDSDWLTAEFIPCLIALVGDVKFWAWPLGDIINLHTPWQLQTALHAVATLQAESLSTFPVYPGATWPLINTHNRFQA
ncbi:hypothetical protein N7501_003153 [Penicillium viridicatum]|nr:hypothetical protein N7501_003153 [Penicillium viridicatum]